MQKSRFIQLLILLWFVYTGALAQQDSITLDPRVKIGQLSNGLTYFIQQNPKPEHKVELRLMVKVGSVVEEEHEQGFAHFTEHMAFNGTKNFPKNELVKYLQSIGVAFGSDLNAYTGFNETVYILPLPSEDEEKLRKGFQVLQDWAGGILMNEQDINEERSIIIEEWRTTQGYEQRLRDQYLPYLLYKSQYAQRLPIGDIELLKTFPAEDLKTFYKKWYRPDLMAIVAVGDKDPAILEAYIQEYFSSLENPTSTKSNLHFEIPEHQESFICLLSDKEAPGTQIQIFYKHAPLPTITKNDYRAFLERLLYGGILNQRLDEIRKKPDAPFIFAGGSYGSFIKCLDYFALSAVVNPEKTEEGLEAILRENERIARFGITKEELERAKKSILNNVEIGFKEMEKIESRFLASRYVNHFLQGKFAEGEAKKLALYQELLPKISPQDIQSLSHQLLKENNRVLIISSSEKDKTLIPATHTLTQLLDKKDFEELFAYQETPLPKSFLETLPKKGQTVEKEWVSELNLTTIQLSNGIKIHVKPTDFKNDEILFTGWSKGGTSRYELEDHFSAAYSAVLTNEMGIAGFSPGDMRKMLAGKNVLVTPNIGIYEQDISGSTSPKDLETTFQLIHLYFTSPRKDKEAFDVFISNLGLQLENAKSNPDFQFSKEISKIIYNNHPRSNSIWEKEELAAIDLDRSLQIFKESFTHAGDFEFVFTGNIDLSIFLPLAEIYLGSLEGKSEKKPAFRDLGIRIPQGKTEELFLGIDEKSQVLMYFSQESPYAKNKVRAIGFLGEVLNNRLIDKIREELSGVYAISARGSFSHDPVGTYALGIDFPCSPDQVETLSLAIWAELEQLKSEGPREEEIQKVKEKRRISWAESQKRNTYWQAQIINIRKQGLSWESVKDLEQFLQEINASTLQDLANELLKEEHLLLIKKFPEKK